MDQKQSAARPDSQRSVGRLADRIRSASSQSERRNDLAHFIPRRRADENAQDDNLTAHHIKPHLRYSS